jgi:putative transposase
VSDKYAFIDAEYAHTADAACAPTIERMCRWLQVSRSGYYEWRNRPPSATAQWRDLLKIKIEALFEASDGTYGYRNCTRRWSVAANRSVRGWFGN